MIRHFTSVARRGRDCYLIRNTLFSATKNLASLQECRSDIFVYRHHSTLAENKPKNRNNENNECLFEKRYITVRTCYDHWIDVPKEGLIFDVEYYDSSPDMSFDPKVPLILALHDTPGSAEDLLPVLNLLAKLGYRVVAPNLPGCGKTKWVKRRDWNVFTGALDERMHFVFDFQSTLDIEKVDVALGYGMGCSTCVALSGTDSNIYRSAALLCPAEHTQLKPVKGRLRFQTAAKLYTLWETLQTRPFVWLYMVFSRGQYGLSGYSTLQVINAARAITGSNYKTLQGFMTRLQTKGVPCCMMYHSVQDAKVPPEVSQIYGELLGIKNKDFIVYKDGKQISNQGQKDVQKGIKVEDETPALLEIYSKPIARMIRGMVKGLNI